MKINRKYKVVEFTKAAIITFSALAGFYPPIFQPQIAWTAFFGSALLALAVAGNAGITNRDKVPFYAYVIHFAGITAAFWAFNAWKIDYAAPCLIIVITSFLGLAAAGQQRNKSYYNSPPE